jgi:PIN domain nuclease of toxin-antitoxin system
VAEIAANEFEELPITPRHAERAGGLALHHRDPFDRMLVAQAQTEDLRIVSRDAIFGRYGVEMLW